MKFASVLKELQRARKDTARPTEAQKDVGNYKKGRVIIHGLSVRIENPKGSVRSGTDAQGRPWESVMKCDYGYFERSTGADGDQVNVFIGPDLDSELVVAIDQHQGQKFDETKFVIAVSSREQGEKLYLANYQKGWKLGPTSTATVSQLRQWLKDGQTTKPFKGQMVKSASGLPHLIQSLKLAQQARRVYQGGQRDLADRMVNHSPLGPGGYRQLTRRIQNNKMLPMIGATPRMKFEKILDLATKFKEVPDSPTIRQVVRKPSRPAQMMLDL